MISLLLRLLPVQLLVAVGLVAVGLHYAGVDLIDQALNLLGVCACGDHWWYFW